MALIKGMEPAPNPRKGGGSKDAKGAHLSLLRQRHNMKGNDSTVQGKTKQYMHIKINHAT